MRTRLRQVMVAATHCFSKGLVETVVRDNINPIEKLERSALIVSSEPAAHAGVDGDHGLATTRGIICQS